MRPREVYFWPSILSPVLCRHVLYSTFAQCADAALQNPSSLQSTAFQIQNFMNLIPSAQSLSDLTEAILHAAKELSGTETQAPELLVLLSLILLQKAEFQRP